MTKTIDITPTWRGILPSLLAVLQNEDARFESREVVLAELERMAKYADEWVTWERQILRHRRNMKAYRKQFYRPQRKTARKKQTP